MRPPGCGTISRPAGRGKATSDYDAARPRPPPGSALTASGVEHAMTHRSSCPRPRSHRRSLPRGLPVRGGRAEHVERVLALRHADPDRPADRGRDAGVPGPARLLDGPKTVVGWSALGVTRSWVDQTAASATVTVDLSRWLELVDAEESKVEDDYTLLVGKRRQNQRWRISCPSRSGTRRTPGSVWTSGPTTRAWRSGTCSSERARCTTGSTPSERSSTWERRAPTGDSPTTSPRPTRRPTRHPT